MTNNKFEEIKQREDCDKKFTLVKKLRTEVKE